MIDYTRARFLNYDMTDPTGDRVRLAVGLEEIVVYRGEIIKEVTKMCDDLGHKHPRVEAGIDFIRQMDEARLREIKKHLRE